MENLAKVEVIAQHLEARASGWTSSEQNLDALLAAVQAIELKESGDEIKRISTRAETAEGERMIAEAKVQE